MIATTFTVDPFGEHLRQGSGTAFLVLVAFLVSFLAIRTSARLTRSVSWWPGGVQADGVHLHHLVWGICLILALALALALASAAKGPCAAAVIGVFLPSFAMVGAIRLARPRSPWARRLYDADRLERSGRRFAPDRPLERWATRLGDLVAGAPNVDDDA
jgi:integral membrane sensor domain MASE1